VIELFARSSAMREVVDLAERVSATDSNLLITGESGSGKDLIASYIHSQSRRAKGPYVKIDCATLPAELLEAELFGYERGAFTGAAETKPGRFEAAKQGTVVLDEVAHLPNESQAKLLRVIESREFERLGGRTTLKLDARLIALTNVELEHAVERGAFREDLFYRLNVIHIRVPPLRDRREDVKKLARYFQTLYSRNHGSTVKGISAAALELLLAYDFPGNARELANLVERAVIVASGKWIETTDWPATVIEGITARKRIEKPLSLAELEAEHIAKVLLVSNGNKTECARILGISRKNLYEKIAKYKID
jgi:transcriptional regulator with PAS, ATPase and Fis domain